MIDEKRIADFFAELVSIDSPSLEEREMADTLKIKFAEAHFIVNILMNFQLAKLSIYSVFQKIRCRYSGRKKNFESGIQHLHCI